jgi:MFS family permease
VLLGCFTAWERAFERRHRGGALVALNLFTRPSYAFGSVLALCYFAGFTSLFFVVALFLQNQGHASALAAGLALTPFAAGSMLSSAVAGTAVHRFGRGLVVAGLATVLAGVLGTVLAAFHASGSQLEWAMAGPLLAAGLGSGLVISPNITLTLTDVPLERAASAAGVVQTIQRIGGALGVAAAGTVMFGRLAARPGDWTGAFAASMLAIAAAVAAALLVGVLEILRH